MSDNAIDIRDLTKRFGRTVALDGLTMSVATGQVHGFLGPNGAGKSTTIRSLLGLLKPTSGSMTLLGGDPWNDAPALHRRLAYVPGDVNLWPNLTGGECIDILCRARGSVDPAKRAEMIERFQLDPRKKARTYSKGNRQKVALVAALASDVELLLLDEPTSGLDPLMERVFTDTIREEHQQGRTVLLSSHILSEVEQLCDYVSIIKDGRIVQAGSLAELRHLHQVSIDADLAAPLPEQFATSRGVSGLVVEDNHVRFDVTDEGLSDALATLARSGVRNLTSTPPTLEELFLRNYGDDDAVDQSAAAHGARTAKELA